VQCVFHLREILKRAQEFTTFSHGATSWTCHHHR
jgi:hypothetical protein